MSLQSVAVVIFTHLTTPTLLVLASVWFIFMNGLDVFNLNWNLPLLGTIVNVF
jgi:hypothetical protein